MDLSFQRPVNPSCTQCVQYLLLIYTLSLSTRLNGLSQLSCFVSSPAVRTVKLHRNFEHPICNVFAHVHTKYPPCVANRLGLPHPHSVVTNMAYLTTKYFVYFPILSALLSILQKMHSGTLNVINLDGISVFKELVYLSTPVIIPVRISCVVITFL
jgi:hypothetical protein